MGKELVKLSKELGINSRYLTEEEFIHYRSNRPKKDDILNYLLEVNKAIEEDIILIGGFCIHPSLLGHRTIRRISNDLDCITTKQGIISLHNSFKNKIFLTLNYKDIFLDYKGVPFGFDVKDTHGWEIPDDFYLDTREFKFKETNLKTISPEYLIALKARRSNLKGRIYGKDRLDTIALIVAPYFKNNLKKVDLEKSSELIRKHSDLDYPDALSYIDSLKQGTSQLNTLEKEIFLHEHNQFLNNLKKSYNSFT